MARIDGLNIQKSRTEFILINPAGRQPTRQYIAKNTRIHRLSAFVIFSLKNENFYDGDQYGKIIKKRQGDIPLPKKQRFYCGMNLFDITSALLIIEF
jgi:hypothetical protein